VALKPGHAKAHYNLGNSLYDRGRTAEALGPLQRAIALEPDSAQFADSLGNVLWDLGRLDEAESAYRRALELQPEYAAAQSNLGNVLRDQGRLDEAIAAYDRALELQPDAATIASNRLFLLHLQPAFDAQTLLAEHRRWAARFAAPLAAEIRTYPNDRTPDRRLRLGFVSADFRTHPVGRLLLPLWQNRDRLSAEVFAYSDVRATDGLTRSLQSVTDHWRNIAGESDRRVAELIREDGIDVLVDLALHTADNRMLVFARKPAPIQLTMLGLPGTSGLTAIEYRLTDPSIDPPGLYDADYAERSLWLPHCFWCYQPHEPAPAVAPLPAVRNRFVTFGCLNQFAKLSGETWRAWIALLGAVPDARLLVYAPAGRPRNAAAGCLRAAGVDPARLSFVPRLSLFDYLDTYNHIDIALDSFPYCGGTTTMDALWMGVPVVTRAGLTAVGRGGVSILANVGLSDLVGHTTEEYVTKAVALAGDLESLAALRRELRGKVEASPLRDGRGYAAAVEAALRQTWRAWCAS
jgi:predicted O-linked N-acetylglucosamine transferase (SPINDLY family)